MQSRFGRELMRAHHDRSRSRSFACCSSGTRRELRGPSSCGFAISSCRSRSRGVAGGFAAGGVVRTIGTGVYHDELCKSVEVGVSRDAVLAAILERGACASE